MLADVADPSSSSWAIQGAFRSSSFVKSAWHVGDVPPENETREKLERWDAVKALGSKQPALLRTKDELRSIKVDIWYDVSSEALWIADEAKAADMCIPLTTISNAKSKDFRDAGDEEHYAWCMAIVSPTGEPQRRLSLEFDSLPMRDLWAYGMRTLLNEQVTAHVKLDSQLKEIICVSQAPQAARCIKEIDIEDAKFGEIFRCRVKVGTDDDLVLRVRTSEASPLECKRVVREFCDDNEVLDVEVQPLYRYVFAMVAKLKLEEDTLSVVDELNSLHLLEVARKAEVALDNHPGLTYLKDSAKERLAELASEVDDRIGKQGPAAAVIALLLRRNIEKMKLINEYLYQAVEAEMPPDHRGVTLMPNL